MKPGIAVMPRASIVRTPAAPAASCADRDDPAVSDDDGALLDHAAGADDDPSVGDDQILRRQIARRPSGSRGTRRSAR